MNVSKISGLVALALVACSGRSHYVGPGNGGTGGTDNAAGAPDSGGSAGTGSQGGSAGTSDEAGSGGTSDKGGSGGTSDEGGSGGGDTDLVDCRPKQICGGATHPQCASGEVLVTQWQYPLCTLVCVELGRCECDVASDCPNADGSLSNLNSCRAGRCQPNNCPGCTPTDPP